MLKKKNSLDILADECMLRVKSIPNHITKDMKYVFEDNIDIHGKKEYRRLIGKHSYLTNIRLNMYIIVKFLTKYTKGSPSQR